jgi:hypothetical protein
MTADNHLPVPVAPVQWDLCDDQPVERTQEEKARILAHLQCMLAEACAAKGAKHADA